MLVDGIKLLEMKRNGTLRQQKIYLEDKDSYDYRFYIRTDIYRQWRLWREDKKRIKKDEEVRILDTEDLLNNSFVLLEEIDEEIDIENIKGISELTHYDEYDIQGNILACKINELIRAVKQLNRNQSN